MSSKKVLYSASIFLAVVIALGAITLILDDDAPNPNPNPNPNPEIYGSWDFFEAKGMGMTGQVRLMIDDNKVTTSNTCFFDGKQVYVETSSPALISSDEIHVLETNSNQKEYSPGFLKCKASIDKNVLQYHLSQETLNLQLSGNGDVMALSRTGKTFTPAKKVK